MSDSKFVRAATLDRIGDLVDDTAGVHLRDLPPFTTLLVWTMNSLYRVVVTHWPEVTFREAPSFLIRYWLVSMERPSGGAASESAGLALAS